MPTVSPWLLLTLNCCLAPLLFFGFGLFIGYRKGARRLGTVKPTGDQHQSASGRFVVDQ